MDQWFKERKHDLIQDVVITSLIRQAFYRGLILGIAGSLLGVFAAGAVLYW
jgi:hypothetical protein